jgi:hypothetical protein
MRPDAGTQAINGLARVQTRNAVAGDDVIKINIR